LRRKGSGGQDGGVDQMERHFPERFSESAKHGSNELSADGDDEQSLKHDAWRGIVRRQAVSLATAEPV
jgi:hypothetical protein